MSKAYSISTVFWIPCYHKEANATKKQMMMMKTKKQTFYDDEEANILWKNKNKIKTFKKENKILPLTFCAE